MGESLVDATAQDRADREKGQCRAWVPKAQASGLKIAAQVAVEGEDAHGCMRKVVLVAKSVERSHKRPWRHYVASLGYAPSRVKPCKRLPSPVECDGCSAKKGAQQVARNMNLVGTGSV